MATQLPEHPDLDQLKRQAKELLRALGDDPSSARERFRILPAYAGATAVEFTRRPPALHDAQSVIAREHGCKSWNELRQQVEERTLTFEAAVAEFLQAATDGRGGRAQRLLQLHPGIAGANAWAALLAGNAGPVETKLASEPDWARTRGGPRDWEPLHYLCHSSAAAAADPAGLVACARLLLKHGADANLRFPWQHHEVHRPVLWGAFCVTASPALARALLEAGADPNDGVNVTLAAARGDVAALELLRAFGADPNNPWATDGATPLYAILQWTRQLDGAYWLLEHGADADPVFAANGETPLHLAAAGYGVDLLEALARRGADLRRPRRDGRTPYALAELNGNRAAADWLRARGAAGALRPVDELVAACSRGDRAAAERLLASQPGLRQQLGPEHYPVFYRAAERNDTAALEALLAAGFDPNRGDEEMGMTVLHRAAMAGWPQAIEVLLAHGASPAARDREFHCTPLYAAAEGARRGTDIPIECDFATVGRLLLAAGSPLDWESTAEPAGAHQEIINAWRGLPQGGD